MVTSSEPPTRPLPPFKKRGPSKRARLIMGFIMLAGLAVGIGLVVWAMFFRGHGHATATQPNPSASRVHRGTVTTQSPSAKPSTSRTPAKVAAKLPPSLSSLQADINSADPATQAQALIPAERSSYVQGPSLLPAGDMLTIDPRTLTLVNHNEHIATVIATTSHGHRYHSHGHRYQLGLYRSNAGSPWLLAISKELS